jgi:hypothetical protein
MLVQCYHRDGGGTNMLCIYESLKPVIGMAR